MTVWSKIQPDYAANMWNEALNKRLGTEVLAFCSKFFSVVMLFVFFSSFSEML